MSDVKCFMLEEVPQLRLFLRRYGGEGCPGEMKYHNALVFLRDLDHPIEGTVKCDAIERAEGIAADDPRWPAKCGCGHAFADGDARQVFPRRLYRRVETGELVTLDDVPAGAMYFASWKPIQGRESSFHQARGGGPHLMVKLPGGTTWDIDDVASNGPGWERTGAPPVVTARPSIQSGNYHGWLTDGVLRACLVLLAVCIVAASSMAQSPAGCGVSVDGFPSWRERAMLVMVNACRMSPVAYRDTYMPGAGNILERYPAVPPLRWALGLNRSAWAHSVDMAASDCFQHNNCPPSTTTWAERIGTYWPGWALLGENIAAGYVDPVTCVGGLLADAVDGAPAPDAPSGSGFDGHRWNIMYRNYTHLGCGFAEDAGAEYVRYWTQDFGRPLQGAECQGGVPSAACGPVVAASHIEIFGQVWVLANVFDCDGDAPASVSAVVDGVSSPMALQMGAAAAGTYRLVVGDRLTGCHVYHVVAIDAAGVRWRYPAAGELAFGCAGGVDDTRPGDFNADGVVSMADVFDFLAAWLDAAAGDLRADADEDGVLSPADVLAFLAKWFG